MNQLQVLEDTRESIINGTWDYYDWAQCACGHVNKSLALVACTSDEREQLFKLIAHANGRELKGYSPQQAVSILTLNVAIKAFDAQPQIGSSRYNVDREAGVQVIDNAIRYVKYLEKRKEILERKKFQARVNEILADQAIVMAAEKIVSEHMEAIQEIREVSCDEVEHLVGTAT